MKPAWDDLLQAPLDIGNLDIPHDVWWAVNEPPLIGSVYPRPDFDFGAFAAHGVFSVVNLHDDLPTYDPSPLRFLWCGALTDLRTDVAPHAPDREKALYQHIAHLVAAELCFGRGVLVHCLGGRGRTSAIIGLAMLYMGINQATIQDFLASVHAARGKFKPYGWSDSSWQYAIVGRRPA